MVYLQRAAHGVALLVRRFDLRTPAGAALPDTRQRPRLDVGGQMPPLARCVGGFLGIFGNPGRLRPCFEAGALAGRTN